MTDYMTDLCYTVLLFQIYFWCHNFCNLFRAQQILQTPATGSGERYERVWSCFICKFNFTTHSGEQRNEWWTLSKPSMRWKHCRDRSKSWMYRTKLCLRSWMQRRTGGSRLKKVRYSSFPLSLKLYLSSLCHVNRQCVWAARKLWGLQGGSISGFSQQRDSHTLYLEQELDSLKVVLDIKNQQLHQQEKKLMELEKLVRWS